MESTAEVEVAFRRGGGRISIYATAVRMAVSAYRL